MSNNIPIQFAVSQPYDCSYLPDQTEQLLIAVDTIVQQPENYERLMQLGFRRSGNQLYRPHCRSCAACQALRLPVESFQPSTSQKRVLKRNKTLNVVFNINVNQPLNYFDLYEKYINERHSDGSMYPASVSQYTNFVSTHWLHTGFLEIYDNDKLIGICVLDILPNALSAVYTFFDPDYSNHSMGTLAVLKAVEQCQALNKAWLYLGYQVDDCAKMNYKNKFMPHQRLLSEGWITVEKNK